MERLATFEGWYDDPLGRRFRRTRGNDEYQKDPNDRGNYYNGVLVGTNRSISAPAYADYLGRPVTEADMRAITENTARDFYKSQVWDKIRGSEIKFQKIANLIADSKSSGGGRAAAQRALNNLGENVKVDSNFGNLTISALNRQIEKNAAKVYNEIRKEVIKHYEGTGQTRYIQGWIDALNKDYPPLDESVKIAIASDKPKGNFSWIWLTLILLCVASIIFLVVRFFVKQKLVFK